MARNDPQVNLRMPADLKSALEDAAKTAGRSLTAEIMARLRASFVTMEGDEFPPPPIDKTKTLYVLLDADGHPTSWPEITRHIEEIAHAGDFAPEMIEARVFNAELASSRNREGEWLALQEHYSKLRKAAQK